METPCRDCGTTVVWQGKERHYCNTTCRQRWHRKQAKEALKRRRGQLCLRWKELKLHPMLAEALRKKLFRDKSEQNIRDIEDITKAIEVQISGKRKEAMRERYESFY